MMDIGRHISKKIQYYIMGVGYLMILNGAFYFNVYVRTIYSTMFEQYLYTFILDFLVCMTIWCYLHCWLASPGVPKKVPINPTTAPILQCTKCNAFKPTRAHHCSGCQTCVLKMDHHCPWVVNCIGINNQKAFLLLGLYLLLSGGFAAISDLFYLFGSRTKEMGWISYIWFCFTTFYLCIMCLNFIGLFAGGLMQAYSNITQIEHWSGKDRSYMCITRSKHFDPNQYDISPLANLTQIFGNNPLLWFLPMGSYKHNGAFYPSIPAVPPVEVKSVRQLRESQDYFIHKTVKYQDPTMVFDDLLITNGLKEIPKFAMEQPISQFLPSELRKEEIKEEEEEGEIILEMGEEVEGEGGEEKEEEEAEKTDTISHKLDSDDDVILSLD